MAHAARGCAQRGDLSFDPPGRLRDARLFRTGCHKAFPAIAPRPVQRERLPARQWKVRRDKSQSDQIH